MGAGYSIKARGAQSAEIYIYEDVGESWFGGVTAKQFAQDLKALGAVETIDVRINSYGGDVFDGLAIYRQLVDHQAKIIVHIDGIAASIASVIAMAGDEIRIAEAGFIMIHDAWAFAMGNAAEMRRMADLLDTTSGACRDVYQARTSLSSNELVTMMAAETWLTASESVAKGFADSVVANLRVAASARVDMTKHAFRNTPNALQARPNFHAAKARLRGMRDTLAASQVRTA